jgi:putative SOS response-associated peptidase YedK
MRWGLIPWWAKDEKLKFSTFNAKAETVTTAPAFRDAWKRAQRCLVVTDGFPAYGTIEIFGEVVRLPLIEQSG